MLSTLSNNVGKFLEPVKTWRMRPLPMWLSKHDFVIFKSFKQYFLRCRTDTDTVTNAYHTLHQASELFNHTSDKIGSVIADSALILRLIFLILCTITAQKLCSKGERAAVKVGTYTSCAVLLSYIETVIGYGSSVISSHSTSSTAVSISSRSRGARGDVCLNQSVA